MVISDICNPQFGPLMVRYYLTPKIFGLRLVLHKFLRSDSDRHLHDHPWNFITWIVKGCYFEHQEDGTFFRKRWSLLRRSKFHKHWVELTTFGDFVPNLDIGFILWENVDSGGFTLKKVGYIMKSMIVEVN